VAQPDMPDKQKALTGKWDEYLGEELCRDYMRELREFLVEEKRKHTIYPKTKDWFSAFHCTPFEQLKVVILGQDPYHGTGQAHGMSFSVPLGVAPPPSLKNIIAELNHDMGHTVDSNTGYLEPWARQGVLLLNSVLTVRANQSGSHAGKGWERFTDKVIETISTRAPMVSFMLWGNYAKQKAALIDTNKHQVLEAAHPSPLSVRGFKGCRHFSRANQWLSQKGLDSIDWRL
jgi:uracil-DNA glycosylase